MDLFTKGNKNVKKKKTPWILFIGVAEKTFFFTVKMGRIVKPLRYKLSSGINSSCCLFLPKSRKDPIQGFLPVERVLPLHVQSHLFLVLKFISGQPFSCVEIF